MLKFSSLQSVLSLVVGIEARILGSSRFRGWNRNINWYEIFVDNK